MDVDRYLRVREDYLRLPFEQRHRDLALQDELEALSWELANTPPPGRKKGLILRPPRLNVVPTLREAFDVIPVSEWSKYLQVKKPVDLERCVWTTLDQDGIGSCAAESPTGIVMCLRELMGLPRVKLNPWSIYWYTSGGFDRGSTLEDNLEYILRYGIAPMDVWPRSMGWNTEPSEEAKREALKYRLLEYYLVTDWEEFGTALLRGWPVYFGYDAHAVFATQLLSETMLEFKNSWGEEWGRNGFGTLHKSRIQLGFGAYAFRSVVWSK